jgi:hypothetical protein
MSVATCRQIQTYVMIEDDTLVLKRVRQNKITDIACLFMVCLCCYTLKTV